MNWMQSLGNWLGVELGAVSQRDRIISGFGGGLAILATFCICVDARHATVSAGLLASMGASAVLLFAVPHGPLSQPWPVIAGHVVSAAIGVACARWISNPWVSASCAVGLSIWAMQQFRCIHPPGGATALTAVIGSGELHSMGFHYVWSPVLVNVACMVFLAVVLNAFFPWRRYPSFLNHRPAAGPPGALESGPTHEEMVQAIRSLESFVDISEDDLLRLVQVLASRAGGRPDSVQGPGSTTRQ